MPAGMQWALFAGSFREKLTGVLGYDPQAAGDITKKAQSKYRKIIKDTATAVIILFFHKERSFLWKPLCFAHRRV